MNATLLIGDKLYTCDSQLVNEIEHLQCSRDQLLALAMKQNGQVDTLMSQLKSAIATIERLTAQLDEANKTLARVYFTPTK